MNKVSVIIPVYNAEKFIARCVESILSQSFTETEILLIDDGSSDKSFEICKEYAILDSRVISLHKENGGVSSARNYGIEKASGDWILFVDVDDYIDREYIEHFFKNPIHENILVIQNEYHDCYNGQNQQVKSFIHGSDVALGYFSVKDFCCLSQGLKKSSLGPYVKLFSAKIIKENKLRFMEGSAYCEDMLFFIRYLNHCDGIYHIGYTGYHYIITQGQASLTRRKIPYNEYLNSFFEYCECRKALLTKYKEIDISWCCRKLLSGCIYGLRGMMSSAVSQQQSLNTIRSVQYELNKMSFSFKQSNWKIFLFFFFIRKLNPKVTYSFLKLLASKY